MKLVSFLSQFRQRFGLSSGNRCKRMPDMLPGVPQNMLGILPCTLVALGMLSTTGFAVTLTVNSSADSGVGSLRDRISAASANDTINFSGSLAGDTITLSTGELVINKNLIIDASALSSPITLKSGNTQRIMWISAGNTVTLRGLTMVDGKGAGTLVPGEDGIGGAVYNAGNTVIDRCIISNNTAQFLGGSLYNSLGAVLTIQNCSFSANSCTDYYGGAIANAGTITVNGSTFLNNSAEFYGGAIYSDSSGILTVNNSTFTANSSDRGGAIFNGNDVMQLTCVTIVGNTATQRGGGVYNDYLNLNISKVINSIVSLNTSLDGANIFGTVQQTTSFINGDPKLSPIGNYGGPTQTMPPLPDSPVIDYAGATTALTTDQRGQPRILAGGLDLGAVEVPSSDYNEVGLTIQTRVDAGDTTGYFQISTDPDFLPTVTTYAGTGISGSSNGQRLSAKLSNPAGVAVDSAGNVFIADSANHRICMVGLDGQVVTIAGTGAYGFANGAGATAQFAFPGGLAVGPDNNVYVADIYNHSIRKLTRPAVAGGSWAVTTYAGTGVVGYQNGSGGSARFNFPYGLTLDASGNVYVADTDNHRIRMIDTSGNVSTYAGTGVAGSADNTNAMSATFRTPRGIVFLNGSLYVADTSNHLIRKILISSDTTARTVSTFAGSGTAGHADASGVAAQFSSPSGITTDGTALYVSDEGNFRIRKIDTLGGVTTEAGTATAGFLDGKSNVARFATPAGIAVDKDGNLIVADYNNHRLRGIAIQPLSVPSIPVADVVPDVTGEQVASILDVNALGLAPGVTYYIRWVSSTTTIPQILGQSFYLYDFPEIETLPATSISPTGAQLNANVDPKNGRTTVALEYSTDPNMLKPYQVSTTAGSGVAGYADDSDPNTLPAAQFSNPSGVVTNSTGDIFVADRANHRIRKITSAGVVTTFAGSGVAGHADDPTPGGASARFELPEGLAIDASNNLYVADTQNHCIRKITPAGVVTTIAGMPRDAGFEEGVASAAKFLYPTGVAVDSAGNVYIADSGNHRIRILSSADGVVSTYAGNGAPGFVNASRLASQFKSPKAVAIGAGNALVVADTGNHSIRVIEPLAVTTLAGDGSEGFVNGPGANAQFSSPVGIARDISGAFFVTDSGNHRIRMIAADGSQVSTLAGTGAAGYLDSPSGQLHPATVSQFNLPIGITVHSNGIVYVTQQGLLRKIERMAELPAAIVSPDPDGLGARDVSALVNLPLRYGTTYYFRARATAYRTTRTGNILSFVTTQAMEKVYDGSSTSSVELFNLQSEVVDFGSTPTGQPVLRSLTIFNPGTAPLTVSSVDLPSGFQLSVPFATIQPGTSFTSGVQLTASTAGSYSGSILITSNAPEQTTFTFSIAGLVLDPPIVTTEDQSDVGAGTATFNANVNPKGSSTKVWFEWSVDPEFDGVNVSTLAGPAVAEKGYVDGTGNVNGTGDQARFNEPSGLAIDAAGNTYVADTENHRIRKIEPDGTTSTFAGSTQGFANGTAATAQFNRPIGIVINSSGMLFVADSGNHCIRSISSDGSSVATYSGLGVAGFTDGVAAAARFSSPSGLAIDASGQLYVADTGNHRVRKVALNGSVSTLAGTGVAARVNGAGNVAQFSSPYGIARDTAGYVYVTEDGGAVRKIASNGNTSTLAGDLASTGFLDANGTSARFAPSAGLAIAVDGSILVADKGNNRIRHISPAGVVKTLAGNSSADLINGVGSSARFSSPSSIAVKADGSFVVSEEENSAIRSITPIQVLILAESSLTGSVLISVNEVITDLPTSGTYYYRAIATNGGGTTIGNTKTVILTPSPTGFEAWQITYFGAQAGNPFVAGPAASPAGDGVANLLKYAFDLNPPSDSAAGDMPKPTVDVNGLSLTYTKVLAATDITYTVQWSANLIDWYDNANPAPVNNSVITEVEVPDPDPDTTQFKATVAANSRAKFLRVRVTQNP